MKRKVRLSTLLLAGVLAYFASEGVGSATCTPQCSENYGVICCTDSNCLDYCW